MEKKTHQEKRQAIYAYLNSQIELRHDKVRDAAFMRPIKGSYFYQKFEEYSVKNKSANTSYSLTEWQPVDENKIATILDCWTHHENCPVPRLDAADINVYIRSFSRGELYHPIQEILNDLPRIAPQSPVSTEDSKTALESKLHEIMDCTPVEARYVATWMMAAVRTMGVGDPHPDAEKLPVRFVNNYVLIISGIQNTGKSTFVRSLLAPFGEFAAETPFRFEDKDFLLSTSANAFLFSDELRGYNEKEVDTIKAFTSMTGFMARAPYRANPSTYKRLCSYVATTNESNILHDPSGERRFLVVTMNKYPKTIELSVARQLWLLALTAVQGGAVGKLDSADRRAQEETNARHAVQTGIGELVDSWLDSKIENLEEGTFIVCSGADIFSEIQHETKLSINVSSRQTNQQLNNAMARRGYHRTECRFNGKNKKGFKIVGTSPAKLPEKPYIASAAKSTPKRDSADVQYESMINNIDRNTNHRSSWAHDDFSDSVPPPRQAAADDNLPVMLPILDPPPEFGDCSFL
jgi:predicted P-loop ATPase